MELRVITCSRNPEGLFFVGKPSLTWSSSGENQTAEQKLKAVIVAEADV